MRSFALALALFAARQLAAFTGEASWLSPDASPVFPAPVERLLAERIGEGEVPVLAIMPSGATQEVSRLSAIVDSAMLFLPAEHGIRAFAPTADGMLFTAYWTVPQVMEAIAVSSLRGGAYSQDFSSLSRGAWTNCVTLAGWQAYTNGVAVESISSTSNTATAGGYYALGLKGGGNTALGVLAPQKRTLVWGCAFTNDTGATLRVANVGFTASQWKAAKSPQSLWFGFYSARGIGPIEEGGDPSAKYTTLGEDSYAAAGLPPIDSRRFSFTPEGVKVAPGEVLNAWWSFSGPVSGSSAIVGIDDFTITFAASGFAVKVAANTWNAYGF